jgi:hypothetical protein
VLLKELELTAPDSDLARLAWFEVYAPDSLIAAMLRLRVTWSELGRALIEAYPTIHKAIHATLIWLSNLLRKIGYE